MMFELRVLSGLHQGAALPLIGEQWLIGADAEHDLALYDPGVAALHCRLTRTEDGWQLKAEDSLINDEEGHARTLTELTPNQTFALGNVWLCLSAAEQDWPLVPVAAQSENAQDSAEQSPPLVNVSGRSTRFDRIGAVIVGVLVGIMGSAWGLSRSASQPSEAISAPVAAIAAPAPSKTNAASPSKVKLASRDAVRRQLNALLSDRLLTDVSVEDSGEGLALKGGLKDDALLVYQRMLQRFNERYELPVPLLDEVATAGAGLPFVIVQIISGTNAHLVTSEGQRLYIGDVLNGLRLSRIDEQRIEFDGDRHVEVRW
ncbi:type III secretion protein D [Pseudomonas frederiksbergensis]